MGRSKRYKAVLGVLNRLNIHNFTLDAREFRVSEDW